MKPYVIVVSFLLLISGATINLFQQVGVIQGGYGVFSYVLMAIGLFLFVFSLIRNPKIAIPVALIGSGVLMWALSTAKLKVTP